MIKEKETFDKWLIWQERGNTNFTQLAEKLRERREVLISKKINKKTYYKIARKEDGQDITDFFDKQTKRIISARIRCAIRFHNTAKLSAECKKITIEVIKNFEIEQINETKNTIKDPVKLERALAVIKALRIEEELLLEAKMDEIKGYFTMGIDDKAKFLKELKDTR